MELLIQILLESNTWTMLNRNSVTIGQLLSVHESCYLVSFQVKYVLPAVGAASFSFVLMHMNDYNSFCVLYLHARAIAPPHAEGL